jgi:hypothetical protein
VKRELYLLFMPEFSKCSHFSHQTTKIVGIMRASLYQDAAGFKDAPRVNPHFSFSVSRNREGNIKSRCISLNYDVYEFESLTATR